MTPIPMFKKKKGKDGENRWKDRNFQQGIIICNKIKNFRTEIKNSIDGLTEDEQSRRQDWWNGEHVKIYSKGTLEKKNG